MVQSWLLVSSKLVIGCFGLQKEFSMRLYSVLIEFWQIEWCHVIFYHVTKRCWLGISQGEYPHNQGQLYLGEHQGTQKHFLFLPNLLYTQKHSLKSVNKRFFILILFLITFDYFFTHVLDDFQVDSTTPIRRKWTFCNNPEICYRSINNTVFMTTVLSIGYELQN